MKTSWALLGASRGLGGHFAEYLRATEPESAVHIFSRKEPKRPGTRWTTADFSTPQGQDTVLASLGQNPPSHVIYFAGGGPYGVFQKPQWKDHLWCHEVSFLFPARLTHFLLRDPGASKSLTLIGSSIAEQGGDENAAMYAAAKAAQRGLFESLVKEKPPLELRLFSPGYMDTDLLPPHSAPRSRALWSPAAVAADLHEFITRGEAFSHRQYTAYPE